MHTTIVVAGAAGGIGSSIVRALLAERETSVIALSRSEERLVALAERLDFEARSRLTTIVGDAGDFEGASEIAHRIEALGGADAAVAALGRGWWTSGPTIDLSPHDWNAVLAEMLGGHFAFARALLPVLAQRPDSLYLSIGGGAAFEPMKDAGLMSVAAAGQAMLTRVLDRERGDADPQIRELIINGPVNTSESRSFADPKWIRDDEVGRVVTELVIHGTTTWPAIRENGPLVVMNERA